MIKAVRCDKTSFKTVKFEPGMNVVIAERTGDSTEKDSRNGLGKTTLIEIIHFCLGSTLKTDSTLARPQLNGWIFYLDVELNGQEYTISRNTDTPNSIFINGITSQWPIKPKKDQKTGFMYMSIRDWNEVLGWLLFGLDIKAKDEKYTPSFRSLISYFIRRNHDAFSIPFEQNRKQLEWDKQVHNLFLLGLDWEFAARWQILKDQEKALQNIKQAAKTGLVPNLMGSLGELETNRVRLEQEISNTQRELNEFKVHPQYKQIEENANALTAQIHQFSNENVSDRRLVEFYEASFRNEKPASTADVIKIYAEIGIALPDKVKKQLNDVLDFHNQITSNRESFLRAEINRLTSLIAERDEKIKIYTDDRASSLSILQTHGALDEYTKLQGRVAQQVSRLQSLNTQIDTLKKFEQGKRAVNIDKQTLQLEAQTDYDERRPIREKAITLYNANSEALYNAAGDLIIDVTPTGFRFQVEIERSGSQGIEQMKVFCYDLTLAQLWSTRNPGPEFLIHDSTIFDGVDERQIAHALELVASDSEKFGFQYICCLNSDLIPYRDFDKNFDINNYKRLTLSDATPDGGLLGIRF